MKQVVMRSLNQLVPGLRPGRGAVDANRRVTGPVRASMGLSLELFQRDDDVGRGRFAA
jgi:hypothetical protein